MGIPGVEPARERWRLKALLDHQDRGINVTSSRVGAQVFLGSSRRLFLLCLLGAFSNPQVYLVKK